jgi:hypothetical protein
MDRENKRHGESPKIIYVYPLQRQARQLLVQTLPRNAETNLDDPEW